MRKLVAFMLAVAFLARITTPVELQSEVSATLRALRKRKVELANEWFEGYKLYWRSEPDWDWQYTMFSALKDSAYGAATTKAQRIAALEKYQGHVRLMYQKIHALNSAGARGGEKDVDAQAPSEFLPTTGPARGGEEEADAQALFKLIEAKIWIAEEQR